MKNIENFKIINHGPNQKENKDFIRTYKLEIINLDNNMSYFFWITPQGEVTYTEGINEHTPTDFEFNLYRIAKYYLIENNLSSNLGVMEVILFQKEYYELLRKKIVVTTEEEQREIKERLIEIQNLVNVPINENSSLDSIDELDDSDEVYVRLSWCNALYAKLIRKGINTELDKEILEVLTNAINQTVISPSGRRYAPSLRVITKVLIKVSDAKKLIKAYGTLCAGFYIDNKIVDVIIHDDEVKLVRKKYENN